KNAREASVWCVHLWLLSWLQRAIVAFGGGGGGKRRREPTSCSLCLHASPLAVRLSGPSPTTPRCTHQHAGYLANMRGDPSLAPFCFRSVPQLRAVRYQLASCDPQGRFERELLVPLPTRQARYPNQHTQPKIDMANAWRSC